ncbi:MAG: two component transcriptional regulator, winged helix family [Hyphomicrobiales bacterium]|jgi:two-component system response regulator TctD|nr:two component transcriptional regulator, winged helix family [Hyphomicrobiales bacterium]
MRLLVVEDNKELAGLLVEGLKAGGYEADRAARADEALHMAGETEYVAIVLDLGLPDADGMSVLRALRARLDATPVLVLTARDSVNNRVEGLRAGADDYLVKPFAFEELLARLEALLRRPQQQIASLLSIADLTLDVASRRVHVGGQLQTLSSREVAVLEILLRRKGRVVPKRLIEDQLFGLSGDVSSNAVEVYVHRLRKQLADRTPSIQIHTIRGVGYMVAETP